MVSIVLLWLNYSNKIIASVGKQRTEISDFSLNQPIEFIKIVIKLAGCISQVLYDPIVLFNAIFNNISVILWQSVLLVEETAVPGENHRPVASH